MNALLVVVATVAMGIEVGWEPLPGGGHEYTIQIEPQLLEVLEKGEDEVFSEVPEGIDVRRYRILVGTGKLRRDSGPLQPTADPLAASPAAREPASRLTQPSVGAPPAGAASPPETSRPSEPQDSFEPPPAGQAQDPLDDIPPAAGSDRFGTPPPATKDPFGTPPTSTNPPASADLELPATEMPELPPAGGAAPTSESPEPNAGPDPNAEPRDPWADSASKGRAETLIVGGDKPSAAGKAPEKLPQGIGPSGSIKQTTLETAAASPSDLQEHEAAKPKLDGNPPNQPWFPLVAAIVLLGCSVGGNIYLGWIALDARARYRSVVAKFRGATA
jgi:hypothetical protein